MLSNCHLFLEIKSSGYPLSVQRLVTFYVSVIISKNASSTT